MKVLVFDIDGTLTLTNRVDGAYFRAAVTEVLGVEPDASWGGTVDFTDAAILRGLAEKVSGRPLTEVTSDVQGHFFKGLRHAAATDPSAFTPVPGARGVFAAVAAAGWVPAMATGAWRTSAEIKLQAAGIGYDHVPLATSSDAERRVDIIRRAIEQAASGDQVDEVVYVGDGTWDVRATRELGIGFVGRASDEERGRLEAEGATHFVEDFTDPSSLIAHLSDVPALVPR